MCWISKNIPKKSRAIRDIPVYKILTYDPVTDRYMAPIMEWTYEFDKKTESILDIPQKVICRTPESTYIPVYVVNSGFHSYRKTSLRKGQKKRFANYIEIFTQNRSIFWHVCIDWFLERFRREILCSAHIPKGSFYYLNEYGEYVSDTLVIDKVSDLQELKELQSKRYAPKKR